MQHRDLQRLSPQSSARDDKPSGRPTNTEATVRAEPTINQLIEARERADAGIRLALPLLAEREGIDEPESAPEIDPQVAGEVGSDLMDARAKLISAGSHLGIEAHRDLHRKLNDLVNQVDDFGALLAERVQS